jgi:predicted outer membrane repeat protein
LPFPASQNPYALVVYDPTAQPVPEPPAPLTWSDGLVLFFTALNLFTTAAFYVINLMPKAFSYRLRLSGNFIRTFNIVMLNCIVMQGAVAQSFGAGEVRRTARRTLKGEKTNQGGEGAGILVGGRSLGEVNVVDMNGLFNTVSNYVHPVLTPEQNYGLGYNGKTGNSIMANGDTAILAVGSYKCSEGTCADSEIMLYTDDLNGEVKCMEDNASCVLDGEYERKVMRVEGTGSGTLILRALTFRYGSAIYSGGGGVETDDGAVVDLKLCVFSNNRCRGSCDGGGAIYIGQGAGSTVNVYGTRFIGNMGSHSGLDDDIARLKFGGTITIYNTCPSPYSSNTPIQGKTRMRIV